VYDFGRVKLHDIAVAPDKIRLLGVGPLMESPTGLNPSKCRAEKRLIGAWLNGYQWGNADLRFDSFQYGYTTS
jgi:hypothetical protein